MGHTPGSTIFSRSYISQVSAIDVQGAIQGRTQKRLEGAGLTYVDPSLLPGHLSERGHDGAERHPDVVEMTASLKSLKDTLLGKYKSIREGEEAGDPLANDYHKLLGRRNQKRATVREGILREERAAAARDAMSLPLAGSSDSTHPPPSRSAPTADRLPFVGQLPVSPHSTKPEVNGVHLLAATIKGREMEHTEQHRETVIELLCQPTWDKTGDRVQSEVIESMVAMCGDEMPTGRRRQDRIDLIDGCCPTCLKPQFSNAVHARQHVLACTQKALNKRYADLLVAILSLERCAFPLSKSGAKRSSACLKGFASFVDYGNHAYTHVKTKFDNANGPKACTFDGCAETFCSAKLLIDHLELAHGIVATSGKQCQQVDYCGECDQWLVGLAARRSHAVVHLLELDENRGSHAELFRTDLLKGPDSAGGSADTYICPGCVYDQKLTPERRWRIFHRKPELYRHMNMDHVAREKTCTIRGCEDVGEFSAADLADHYIASHHIFLAGYKTGSWKFPQMAAGDVGRLIGHAN
ncbi:hypothetical protein HDU89_007542 [Geranomyces variabilis]|nr:hypothetical protein HDU89_007542 [Geranomyces variabilis]